MSTTVVATYRFRHEAELAVSFLSAQGVNAVLLADDEGGAVPGLQPARVLVSSDDAEVARKILSTSG